MRLPQFDILDCVNLRIRVRATVYYKGKLSNWTDSYFTSVFSVGALIHFDGGGGGGGGGEVLEQLSGALIIYRLLTEQFNPDQSLFNT